MRATRLLLTALLLAAPATTSAQSFAIQGVEHYLRVQWETSQGRRGPVVAGYVYNLYGQTADRVRLVIETLDANGQVTGSTYAHLLGQVPSGGRGYFEAPAPTTPSSRVRVLSFDPVGRGG